MAFTNFLLYGLVYAATFPRFQWLSSTYPCIGRISVWLQVLFMKLHAMAMFANCVLYWQKWKIVHQNNHAKSTYELWNTVMTNLYKCCQQFSYASWLTSVASSDGECIKPSSKVIPLYPVYAQGSSSIDFNQFEISLYRIMRTFIALWVSLYNIITNFLIAIQYYCNERVNNLIDIVWCVTYNLTGYEKAYTKRTLWVSLYYITANFLIAICNIMTMNEPIISLA